MHFNMCSLMLLTECSQKSRTKTPCSWTQSLFLFPLQLHFHLQTHHIFPIQMNLFKIKMTWRDGTPIINQYVQETTACTHLPAKSSAASSDKQQTISQSYIAFLVNSARKSIPSWSAFQASAAAPPAQYHLSRGWAETKLQRGIGNVRRSWQTTVESLV